eukprot:3927556-Pyramimonas_sp.AAC.1
MENSTNAAASALHHLGEADVIKQLQRQTQDTANTLSGLASSDGRSTASGGSSRSSAWGIGAKRSRVAEASDSEKVPESNPC